MAETFEELGFTPEEELGFVEEQKTATEPAQGRENISFRHHPIMRALADIAAGGAAGGQALHDVPYNVTRMISPETAEKLPQFLQPTKLDTSRIFGVPKPTIGDVLLQGAARYAPYGALGGPVASGAIAGATQAEDPLKGAAIGAGIGALGTAAPVVGRTVGRGLGRAGEFARGMRAGFTPETTLDEIQSIVPQAEEQALKEGKNLFQSIFEHPSSSEQAELKNYQNLVEDSPKNIKRFFPKDVRNLHDDLGEDPNIENAHWLQSQIGSKIRNLENRQAKMGGLSVNEQNNKIFLQNAKNALTKDINAHLGKLEERSPELTNAYNQASSNWRNVVEPWRKASLEMKKLGPDATPEQVVRKFRKYPLNQEDLPPEFLARLERLRTQIQNLKTAKRLGLGGGILAAGEGIRRTIPGLFD